MYELFLALGDAQVTDTLPQAFADLPTPYYWWECGALMGAMLDYSHYTNDSTYDDTLTAAISYQVQSPGYDLMVVSHYGDEGNDDQAFWTFAVLSAAERNFPQKNDDSIPSWLQVAENSWNTMAGRWNTSACGGGLLWQIFASNPNGMNYRNSVSNGGLFQVSARLYRATGNQTYLDWANKIWDWTAGVGFLSSDYYVFDGADSADNCTEINQLSFSYAQGIYLYGAAVLANTTNDTDASTWLTRTQGLLGAAGSFFINDTNIMYEHACEPYGTCNTDMKSFKGYLSRFMASTARMLPALSPQISTYLQTSAQAIGKACTGGDDKTTCGQKWYEASFDGSVGLGQEMSALETIHGLLAGQAAAPLRQGEIQDVRQGASTPPAATGTSTPSATSAVSPGVVSTTATSDPTSTKRSHSLGVRLVPVNPRVWFVATTFVPWLVWVVA